MNPPPGPGCALRWGMDDPISPAAGTRMPPILYGTAWKKRATAQLVAQAIRHGFRGIDTACQPRHYDEAGVGEGIAVCLGATLGRADLYLQTKFTPASGQDTLTIPYDPQVPLAAQVAQSLAASLRNLRTDYLDGLLLHSPLATQERTFEAWRALESVADTAAVRQIGLSNVYRLEELAALCKVARVRPAVLQNRFYVDTGYDREIRAFCAQQRIVYQSFWTLTANPQIVGHALLRAIAARMARTPAQVLFRYLTQRGVVPLTGTRSDVHMLEDLAILEFDLPPKDLQAIDGILAP